MGRFRMGTQMKQILEVLNNLKNPPEGVIAYHEASYGINQTEIILRVLNLKPYRETRFRNRDRWIKPIEEGIELIKELEGKGKIVKTTEAGSNLVIDAYDGEYEYEPPQMRLASALMEKRMGQSASPYNFMGRMMAVNLALKNPEMKNDPSVKRHFDWVDSHWEGKKRSDKIYASFSRSLKILLDKGLISSNYYVKGTGKKIRNRLARYLITFLGMEYLRGNIDQEYFQRRQ